MSHFRTAVAAILMLLAGAAGAQQDSRVVRIIVPAPAGGTLDLTGRVLAQRLSITTGQSHIVENRPGANTIIGIEHVIRSAPDGLTLLLNGQSVILNPLLQKVSYDPFEDLTPVTQVSAEHYALLAAAPLEAAGVSDLERIARARPGGLNCGAPPGPMRMACEQLKLRLGGAVTLVPFAGVAPAVAALAGAHVDVTFVTPEAAARLLESNKARVLAVSARTGGTPSSVPLISEIWPDFVTESVQGVYVPAATPAARVQQLQAQVAHALADPEFQARLRAGGVEPLPASSPEAFTARLKGISGRYAQVVRKLGLSTVQP